MTRAGIYYFQFWRQDAKSRCWQGCARSEAGGGFWQAHTGPDVGQHRSSLLLCPHVAVSLGLVTLSSLCVCVSSSQFSPFIGTPVTSDWSPHNGSPNFQIKPHPNVLGFKTSTLSRVTQSASTNLSLKEVLLSVLMLTQMNSSHSVSHSFNKYLLSASCVPSAVLGAGAIAGNEVVLPLWSLLSYGE